MQAHTIKSMYNKAHKTYQLSGIYAQIFGEPERNGCWLIWGEEKQGKTTLALILANYFSTVERTLYISAEEGLGKNFKDACRRAGIDGESKLRLCDYTPMDQLMQRLDSRRPFRVVVIDNITVYNDELKYGAFLRLLNEHPDKLFIFLAHEEAKRPYGSTAKLCSRYAKVKIHVRGLAAFVEGRCPGGTVKINEDKASIYWGSDIKNETSRL